jgi:pimeloyl-ACP methyl ester carboxylesterase
MGGEVSMRSSWLAVEGRSLELYEWSLPGPRDTIILIHEALGSASYWKAFPEQLAQTTCANVVAYSRAGHGESQGPLEPRSFRYYQQQVEVVLPNLLRQLKIETPILYGHSEGAAIAFLYAAGGNPVKAIIAESPIVAPEESTLRTVEQMNEAQPRAELIERLRRYHRNPAAVFASWVEGVQVNLARQFPAANYLRHVNVPVLVIEGALDPFGGDAQRTLLETEISNLRLIVLPQAGHLPHREQPEQLVEAVARFLTEPLRPESKALVDRDCGSANPRKR